MRTAQGFWCCGQVAAGAVHDGDTLRVQLAGPAPPEGRTHDAGNAALDALAARVRTDRAGAWPVRLAGLDAPELDYPLAPAALCHQPLALAVAAREALLHAVCSARPAGHLRLWVTAIDPYGRLVAGLWRAQDDMRLAASINAGLLRVGAAYPDFHEDLPAALLATLHGAVRDARRQRAGLWAHDRTDQRICLTALTPLAERRLVWPRLWRRIMACAQREAGLAAVAPVTAITGWQLRDYLTRHGGQLRALAGGPWKNLAEHLEITGQDCRFPGHVENFLHRTPPDRRKLPQDDQPGL